MNKLDQLNSMSLVVADTADLDAISQYQLQDAMATEKLAHGIRLFARDQEVLESRLMD